jgi:hypothetical protein
MSDKDRAEMEKAVADVAKLKSEMANLPKSVQGMMQSQIDRLEKMVGTGDGESIVEAVIDVLHVAANEGPPYPGGVGDFSIHGEVDVRGAMVLAEFPEVSMENNGIQFPVSLEFSGAGREGGFASLSIRDIVTVNSSTESWVGEVPEASVYLRGIARASYEKPDGETVEWADHPAEILVLHWTITEVWGRVYSEHAAAHFIAGHMPCSSKPRAIAPAELDKLRSGPSKDMPTPLEQAYRQILGFEEQCSY